MFSNCPRAGRILLALVVTGLGACVGDSVSTELAAGAPDTGRDAIPFDTGLVRVIFVAAPGTPVPRALALPGGTSPDPTAVALAIDTSLTVEPTTGVVYVTGAAYCSRDVMLDLQVDLQQDQAGHAPGIVRATETVAFPCGTAAGSLRVAVAPFRGAFARGAARASAQTLNPGSGIVPASASSRVRLYRGGS